MPRVVWLASYPKSGNTWVRAFLTNYFSQASEPASINELIGIVASSRQLFEEISGLESSDLTSAEIEAIRPAVYAHIVSDAYGDGPIFLKVHDAHRIDQAGPELFPLGGGARVIYVVRSPLDVAVSFAQHFRLSLDEAVEAICSTVTLSRSAGRLASQLPQRLGSWSEHVNAWTEGLAENGVVIRYEDLLERPTEVFRALLTDLALPVDADRLAKAVAWSSFSQLKQQEEATGFREGAFGTSTFFRRGEAGNWRNILTREHVTKIVTASNETMARFGYLTDVTIDPRGDDRYA